MTDLETIKEDFLRTAEFAYGRLHGRLQNLTDDEYLWEPAPGCWSIRKTDKGWKADGGPIPVKPAPLTTIAWRLDHVIDILAGDRNATWIGAEPQGTVEHDTAAPTAKEAIGRLERAFELFKRNIQASDAAGLTTAMGEIAGPYGKDTRAAFVLHELDELIHHGSEIAAMRDMYRALTGIDPIMADAERLDRAAVEARAVAEPALRSSSLVTDLSALERWDAVRMLVDLGFDVNASHGITALHYAAAFGQQEIAELLIKHGADLTVKDTEFEIEPAGWADFFKHTEVANYLRDQVPSAG